VKIRVQSDHNGVPFASESNDLDVFSLRKADFSDVLACPPRRVAAQLRHRAEYLDRVAAERSRLRRRSRGWRFRCHIFQISGGEGKGLPYVLGVQLGVISEKLVAIGVKCHGLDDATNREPHTADTRLPIHLVRVPGDPVKTLHREYCRTAQPSLIHNVLGAAQAYCDPEGFASGSHAASETARLRAVC
jgi:hypothetical protein